MAAAVVTKILRGFLKNIPKGEAKELAGRYGFLKDKVETVVSGRKPKQGEQLDLLVESVRKPKQVTTTEIDLKEWEKAGFPGVSEYATERVAVAQQTQKRLQSELEQRLDLDIVDIEKATSEEKVARVKEINKLREVGVAQERLNRFAGREFSKGETGELLPITDEQLIERGYEKMGARVPPDLTRDEFGHLLPEFKEWGKVHELKKRQLRVQEQKDLKAGKIETLLPEEQMDEVVRSLIDRDPLYGRPFGLRFRRHIPWKGIERKQFAMIPEDIPPTKQDVMRLSRGEEVPSEIIAQPEYEKVIGEEIATSRGMAESDIPSLQDVISVRPTQENVLFRQEIPGLPRRQDENTLANLLQTQAKREQFLGRLDTFGRRAEPTAIRGQQELPLEVPSIADPKIIARLRKEAAALRYKRTRFRQKMSEEVQKNPYKENAHEKAWDKIKNTKAYKKYVQDRIKLKREINIKAPDLMEADPFEVTRETIRPKRQTSLRLGVEGEPSEQYLDRVVSEVGKIKQPTKRLADSFKKGSKVVKRKRGGMIKKPRGWGAARYNTN